MTWREKIASVPMSLAMAVMIAVSAVRSSAGREGQPLAGGGPAKSATDVHRVGGRAAVAEGQQPPAGVEGGAQVGRRGAQGLEAVAERLLAQGADLVGLHRRRGGDVAQDRVEVVLLLAQEGIEEARRADVVHALLGAALEQAAMLEEDVHELPEHVVGRLGQLLAHEGVGARRLELPLGAERAKATVRQPRSRASATRLRELRAVGRLAEGDDDVVGLGDEVELAQHRAGLAGQPEGRQRALAHDDRVHELDGDVARVRARRRGRADGHEPAVAREALGHAMAQARQARHAVGRVEPLAGLPALGQPALHALTHGAGRGRGGHTAAPERAATSSRQPRPPRVDPLAGARADEHPLDVGVHGVEVVQEALEIDLQVRHEVELVDQHEVARAEHQRVLQRLVLALGDRGDHHARVLADVELRRAHEVADVLDDEQVDVVQRQRGQGAAHHVGVEVALAAEARVGVELGHRHMQAGQPVGVHRALHVALEHADAHAVDPVGQQRLEQRRLARPRRAHEVDHGHAVGVEVGPVGAGDRVVGVQRVLDDPDLHAVHAGSSCSTSIDSTRNSSPLTTVASAAPHAAQRKSIPSTSHSWPQRQRRRAGTSSCSRRAPSHTVPRATCSK